MELFSIRIQRTFQLVSTSQKHVGMTVMHHVGAFITVDVECLIHCICFLFILYSFSSAVHYEVHGSASHHAC